MFFSLIVLYFVIYLFDREGIFLLCTHISNKMRANCIICSDFFDEINPMCSAKCGHVYHTVCLTTWFNQSKSCPYCRAHLTLKDIHKIHFNFPSESDNSYINSSKLENEVSNLKSQLLAKDAELVACKKEKNDMVVFVQEAEKRASELQETVYKLEFDNAELRLRVESMTILESVFLKAKQVHEAVSNNLEYLNNVQSIINGTLQNALKSYNNHSEVARQLVTYCAFLKHELKKLYKSRSKLNDLKSYRQDNLFAAKIKFYAEQMAISNKKEKHQLLVKIAELATCEKEKNDAVVFLREAEKRANDLMQRVHKLQSNILEQHLKVKSLIKFEASVLKFKQMNIALSNCLERINMVIDVLVQDSN